MNVLVIGFGKIGRIKSAIWQELGAEVIVYDINKTKIVEILREGYKVYDDTKFFDGIVDISTPAGHHIKSLSFCLSQDNLYSQTILIEKPLVSTKAELHALQILLRNHPELNEKLLVNETYYVSSALDEVNKYISENNEQIIALEIELSKNRLADVNSGRFFDDYLESIGIEVPHMIAISESLGVDIRQSVNNSRVVIYSDDNRKVNQTFVLDLEAGEVKTRYRSNLGDFRIEDDLVTYSNEIIRKVKVQTDKNAYRIIFDPAPNGERFCSYIDVNNSQKLKSIKDNHLSKFLKLVYSGDYSSVIEKVGLNNSLLTCNSLFKMRESAEFRSINSTVKDNVNLKSGIKG